MTPPERDDTESPLTPAEWTVMDAVWRTAPATVRDVMDDLGGSVDWAYTTVKTMMDRLVAKGVLESERPAAVRIYRPSVSRDDARRAATRSFVERAFGGSVKPLVHHLLDLGALDEKDRAEIARILAGERGERGEDEG